jgi:hypothetical protein
MSKAISVTPEDWKFASKIKTNQDFFNFLSRTYTAKETLQAHKLHQVEFFAKP